MVIVQRSDGWYVVNGNVTVAGQFATNAQAWNYADRESQEHRDMVDRNSRIRDAFAGDPHG